MIAWQPTLVFLPGESHGQRAWQATVHRIANSWTRLKRLRASLHKIIIPREGRKQGKKHLSLPWEKSGRTSQKWQYLS